MVELHSINASGVSRAGELWSRGGRICLVRVQQPAAEARKAEGASVTALQTPRPPCETGSDACSHVDSARKSTFRTALMERRS